jgi:hypothetical protein
VDSADVKEPEVEVSKIAPFEIEGTNRDEDVEYPTGIQFWLILMAALMALILVGLVRLRFRKNTNPPVAVYSEYPSFFSSSGPQHPIDGCPSHDYPI